MQHIFSPDCSKKLYFDGNYNESKFIAFHGIDQIVKMHSGRGGSLDTERLTQENKKLLFSYFNALYWSFLKDDKPSISELFLFQQYTKVLNFYEPFVVEKVFGKLQNMIGDLDTIYKVHISCSWTDTKTLYKNMGHLFEYIKAENGDTNIFRLGFDNGKVRFVLTEIMELADYFIILWGSHVNYTDEQLSRALFFRTEPCFQDQLFLGSNKKAEPFKFLKYYDYHDLRYPNCLENWLQISSSKLLAGCGLIKKPLELSKCLSSVVSNKYSDPGHRYRIDLLRYIVKNIDQLTNISKNTENTVHIYGFNNDLGFPENFYKGRLPDYNKSLLMKYKYTLIAENTAIEGYMTEKIADGILSECLVFYWGCPNLERYFPDVEGYSPFVRLPMEDPVKSYEIIKTAISEEWWEKRLDAILTTKKLILSKYMLQHRFSQVIEEEIDRKILGEDGMNLLRLSTAVTLDGKTIFPKILYSGVRFAELKKMIERRCGSNDVLEKYRGLSGSIPKGVPLMQEFSNKVANAHIIGVEQFIIGYSRFSVKDFDYKFPKTYVINLKRRKDRLEKFYNQFPKTKSWDCERFEAVDGKLIKINGEFPLGIKHLFRNNDFGWREGVVGCAMSHIKLWQKLVADDENDSYIIYEDDVEFAECYTWKLYNVLQKITFSWDMLFLGHLVCYEEQTNHRVENDELPNWEMMSDYIVPRRTSWLGTASYMISKMGAQKLLDYIEKNGVGHGIDYLIQLRFPDLLRAYGVRPMLNFADYASSLNPNIEVDSDIQ
jgi:GR25 family glycosyltransferase involved in LPS biosynthesis